MAISNQKQSIIEAITTMNGAALENLLADNLTYNEFSKEEFIARLQYVFENYKKTNDTFLHAYPGTYDSPSCNPACVGISFIGNISRNNIDFIFEEDNDIVTDIFECTCTKTDGPQHTNRLLSLNLKEIERDDYVPF